MDRIERKEYLNKLIALKDKQLIKVITGVRRCGKSTIMEIFQDYLKSEGIPDNQIIAVNLEDYDFYELRDPQKLYRFIKEHMIQGQKLYVFLDEIQNVKDFPDVVNSLFIKKDIDLYLTGSNAYMLSSEIATFISGRYVEIKMLPLSFKEYVDATGGRNRLEESYRQYIELSSLPYALDLKDNARELNDYLNGVYSTIVLKDVAARKRISDPMMLESVVRFTFDNIGNYLSTKKIADAMTSDGRKIDTKTVEKYIAASLESYVLYQARRYDIKGKQYLKTLEKYYVVDIGLRRVLLGSKAVDVGHILENIVYLELLRRGYNVYVGKVSDLEIDFVASNERGQVYFQVSATVRNEEVLHRELAPLQQLSDNYPKYILTLDNDPEADYEGIRRINALEWLVGENY
ncbi:MAG: ATP-binding protein [Lachnospiraceae bacterium]|nr:ATP-binding protein [Lachnospiraceae bacterium]